MLNRTVEVEATTLQASIIELFEGQKRWTTTALADQLGVKDEDVIRAALVFWAGFGVLLNNGSAWILYE
jgi:anaphase-promoting complex subunit 2